MPEVKLEFEKDVDESSHANPSLIDQRKIEVPPKMTDPEWEKFILGKFVDSELDNGKPKVNGLRRITKLYVGPILSSKSKVIQCPTPENNQRATVEHTVKVLQIYNLDPLLDLERLEIEITEASDVWLENIKDRNPLIGAHPVATASTRSESRALRKLLNLSTIAAEEDAGEVDKGAVEGKMTENQLTMLDIQCEKNNIDLLGFIRLGGKYNLPSDVPYSVAQKMFGVIDDYKKNKNDKANKTVGAINKVLGYKPEWRATIKK
jgi:hypothetical protein